MRLLGLLILLVASVTHAASPEQRFEVPGPYRFGADFSSTDASGCVVTTVSLNGLTEPRRPPIDLPVDPLEFAVSFRIFNVCTDQELIVAGGSNIDVPISYELDISPNLKFARIVTLVAFEFCEGPLCPAPEDAFVTVDVTFTGTGGLRRTEAFDCKSREVVATGAVVFNGILLTPDPSVSAVLCRFR